MNLNHQLEHMILMQLPGKPVTLSTDTAFEDIPGWDSMLQVNLMFGLEQELGVRFDSNEIFEFETLGALNDFVTRQLRRQSVGASFD